MQPRAASLTTVLIVFVIALVVLLVLSVLLFRGRSRDEPGEAAADIQYGSGTTSGRFSRGRFWRWITRR